MVRPLQNDAANFEKSERCFGDQVKILKIDVDKNQAIAQKLQIKNVPTIALYKNGNQLFRQAGVLQSDQLIQLVKQHS